MRDHRVHVVATGGTIASTGGDEREGAAPELTGEDLVSAVPDLESDLFVETVADRPGFDMGPDILATVCNHVNQAAEEVDGVVVTHGTDTLEESAYYLDLVLNDTTVVVTGAQRRPDETSPDGPANLRDAVRTAAEAPPGSYVVFDGEVHAARDVTKAHTQALSTFTSPETGPLATFTRDGLRWYRDPPSTPTLDIYQTEARVPVVQSGSGVPADAFERALPADGVVVAATGLGNVTSALGDALADAPEGLPLVVASRCLAGPMEAVYGTPGGAVTLRNHGVQFADDLPPWKARTALQLAIAAGRAEEFEQLVER